MKKFFEIIKNKWLIKGTTTVLLVAIVIACYILLNWAVEMLNLENLDFTEKKLYSLSTETKDKIKGLEEDVTIELINMSDYTYVKEYVKKYTAVTNKIKIEEIDDLASRVDLMTKYKVESAESLIVVKQGEKEKVVNISDLFTYDYSTNQQIDTTEEALTNAIVEVNLKERPQIYIVSGKTYYNVETALYTITQELKEELNDVHYLDILSKGSIPEDCDCLIITTLASDFSEFERDKILEYINRGGKILMLTSQNIIPTDMPNLDAILAQYGISIEFGAVFEQDSSRMLQDSPEFIIEPASASFMSNIDMNLKMSLLDAGKIQFAEESKLQELKIAYEVIVKTSESAFVRTNFDNQSAKRTDADSAEGSAIIGTRVTKTITDDVESKLIIYANELCASNLPVQVSLQYYDYAINLHNNKDVILNSISHLTERTETITIRKVSEEEKYSVSEQEDAIIKTIIFVIPMLTIGAGIVIWQIRRRSI